MILVDEAIWRWRGRRWAHLVSDTSHEELHAFAAVLGLRRAWFQGDHYDVPTEIRALAIALGAQPVSGRELVARLRAAGLRKAPTRPRSSRTPRETAPGRPEDAPTTSWRTPSDVPVHLRPPRALDPSLVARRTVAHAAAVRPWGTAGSQEATMSERDGYAAGIPCWVDLTTTDPESALTFYEALFGWELERGAPEFGGYVMCRLDGRRVAGINGQPGPEGFPPAWITYLATDDADATVSAVGEAGGQALMGPMDVGDQGRMALVADAQGAVVGLWEAREHRGAELVNEPGCLSWNELATTDLDAAVAFLGAVFGHGFEDVDTGSDGPRYRTFSVGGRAVGGILEMGGGYPEGIPPHWMPYFAVADCDAAAAQITALGGVVHVPPMDTDFGRWATVADPQGAAFTIITLPDGMAQ
jgi:uncharacterized protein